MKEFIIELLTLKLSLFIFISILSTYFIVDIFDKQFEAVSLEQMPSTAFKKWFSTSVVFFKSLVNKVFLKNNSL